MISHHHLLAKEVNTIQLKPPLTIPKLFLVYWFQNFWALKRNSRETQLLPFHNLSPVLGQLSFTLLLIITGQRRLTVSTSNTILQCS